MPKLIQIRQQITAVETIKKITHAMRLISMSSHSRMRNLQKPLEEYTTTLSSIFASLLSLTKEWSHPVINPPSTGPKRSLLIVAGSQKSLCGSFNIGLLNYFKRYLAEQKEISDVRPDIVIIGKRMVDMITEVGIPIHATYDSFSLRHLAPLTQKVLQLLMNASPLYSSATIISNVSKSFFIQRARSIDLVPFVPPTSSGPESDATDYLWYHTPEQILSTLIDQYLEAKIYHTLFESLISEHAARFVSMDSSTRNAQSLLEKARSEYNKLRQAKITKELTELTSSFSS